MIKEVEKYDLVIIGGGPAGTPVAFEYGSLNPNKKILLIDKLGKLGGECLFEGCIPSKILVESGVYYNSFKKSQDFGIKASSEHPHLIWKDVVKRKVNILEKRSNAALNKLKSLKNVVLKKGIASFIDNNSIKINLTDENKEEIIGFKKVVIATGTRTYIPPITGNGVNKVWTNNEFFRDLIHPKDITIIGDGPIGIELSQILSNLDVKVNLIGNLDYILPMIDRDFSQLVLDRINNNSNINLILNANVSNIDYNDNEFEVKYEQNGDIKIINSSYVLMATGRTPNIENLNLEAVGIKYNKKGIIVDKYLQTSNKNIYAGGDVIFEGPQFAHTATYEAHIMSQNLFFGRNKFNVDFDKNSWVLFSEPNVVSAGLNETQAKNKGHNIITGIYDYSTDAKSQIDNEALGFLKFIVDKKTLRIIGVNIITPNAQSISGEASLIVANKINLKDLVSTIHPHPTLSESFTVLAKMMMGDIIKERMKNPMFKIGFFLKKWF